MPVPTPVDGTAPSPPVRPKHLKASYLAPGELLLRESLGTPWFYLPSPVLALLVVLFFDYAACTIRSTALPGVPGLTGALRDLPTFGRYGPANYVTVFVVLLTTLAILWLTVRYARWISTVYAATTSRVIVQRGILSRDFDQIPILQVRGIDVHQTIVDRIFRYGTIVISSEGGNRLTRLGNEAWQGIPRPFEFQRIIEAATQNLARSNSTRVAAGPTAPPADPFVPGHA